jgi:hypothetical protein
MKTTPVVLLYLICLANDCRGQKYDRQLKEPDCCGTGYVLTPLGRLVYGPWEADFDRYNQAVYWEAKEISSAGIGYSPLQQDLVFELLQDGSVRFWYKHDYDLALKARTSPDSNGILRKTNEQPAVGAIKKIYTTGNWTADFKDSSLVVDFGKEAGIPTLKGKYKELGSDYFSFQEISYFDSTYLGSMRTLKKVNTIRYTHPWINKF